MDSIADEKNRNGYREGQRGTQLRNGNAQSRGIRMLKSMFAHVESKLWPLARRKEECRVELCIFGGCGFVYSSY